MKSNEKKRGIVITTSKHTEAFFDECIQSIKGKTKYPIMVVINDPESNKSGLFLDNKDFKIYVNDWNGYEMGGIQRGAEVFDEFIHLMDTTVVKKPIMFDVMFAHDGSVALCRGFFSYLGKYVSEIVQKTGVPKVENKEQAIYHEHAWHKKYMANDPKATMFHPSLPVTTEVFEEKHGRTNMVLDNGLIVKYKGTWK